MTLATARAYPGSMTDLPAGTDGGLDEPEELQPVEGSLRLVGDGDA